MNVYVYIKTNEIEKTEIVYFFKQLYVMTLAKPEFEWRWFKTIQSIKSN